METITLATIRQEQNRVAQLIEQFEAQNGAQDIVITATKIALATGEHYAGLILNEDGTPSYHLILLPEEAEEINWGDAERWAAEAGGVLPNRREQALLYANLKDRFGGAWYWSSTQHDANAYAWCQNFNNGLQDDDHKSRVHRARAIRKVRPPQ